MAETPDIATEPAAGGNLFSRLTMQQKLTVGAGLAAMIGVLVGMWMWGQTPDYRVLYSNLTDRDGGTIIDSLQQMNIPYKFSDGGGALLVPSDKVHEARLKLASQGLPKGGNAGFELMENQRFGITQFAEQVNYQRALEGELARSVESIGSVASARVHLALPKPSVFVKEQRHPSASVVLALQGGRILDSSQVSAIIHLISSSVPDMSAKNVTVVDQNGNLLSANQNGLPATGLDANQLKYVRQIEDSYIQRIQDMLTPLLGKDNVRTQVTADIDFSTTEQMAESYKPNPDPASSTVRSQQNSEVLNGNQLDASGIPGALSNQPPAPSQAQIVANGGNAANTSTSQQNITNLQKDSRTNFEVDRTIRHTVLPVGSIKRIAVAVVVNGNRQTVDAKGKPVDNPLSDAEKQQIEQLVRGAMGYDQTRGDIVNIEVGNFTEPEKAPEVPWWQRADMIELAKELLKYGLIAGLLLFLILRVIKPAVQTLVPPPSPTGGFEAEEGEGGEGAGGEKHAGEGGEENLEDYSPQRPPYEQTLHTARQIAQQDPKIVASVIKEWVNNG